MNRNLNETLLDERRRAIDSIDMKIISLLKKRFEAVEDIGRIKLENGISINQPERIDKIIQTRRRAAEDSGLSPDLIERIYRELIDESMKIEEELL